MNNSMSFNIVESAILLLVTLVIIIIIIIIQELQIRRQIYASMNRSCS